MKVEIPMRCLLMVVAVVPFLLSGCHSEKRAAKGRAERLVQQYRVDLDADGRADNLKLFAATPTGDSPTVYNRLELDLSGGRNQVLTGDWGGIPSSFHGTGNRLDSKDVYLGRFAGAGDLLFLFGAEYGCCLPSLQVYRATRSGLEAYFASEQFSFLQSPQPHDTVSSMAGVECMTETVGSENTYTPIIVVRLGRKAEIDSVASERRTRQELGVFAGLRCLDRAVSVGAPR